MKSNNKNARSNVDASERADETREPQRFSSRKSQGYSTTNSEKRQLEFVESFLPQGRENALSTQELLRLSGIKSARELQAVIASERARGALILSDAHGGYFAPDGGEKGRHEMEDFIHTLTRRSKNTLAATKSAKAALRDFRE